MAEGEPLTQYTWIVVVGAFMAFFMAYGIGANDVANAFATSVGSGTLKLWHAVILAAIFEFGGAVLLGRGVTGTIRKGIIDFEPYISEPQVLMYGNLCALTAAGIWLIVATYLELPVSTTHSIIGGLVGFSLVAHGGSSVIWHKIDRKKAFPIKGISSVVISWVFSPVASGIVAAIFFFLTRALILRSENSFERTFVALPLLIFLAIYINAFYVLDKGKFDKLWGGMETWEAAVWAILPAGVCGLIGIVVAYLLWQRVKDLPPPEGNKDIEAEAQKAAEEDKPKTWLQKFMSADPEDAIKENATTAAIHDNADTFDARTEGVFRYLQILTACCDAFAHGANDVANSVGPFSSIWGIYRAGGVEKKVEVEVWILIIGGAGIVVGLATYGYTIIKAIGVKLIKITPSRGYCIELGSALVVVTGSYLGLPLSTTHCQVGATVAVGLLEGARGVSWTIVGKACVGWVITLVIVGGLSALLMVCGVSAIRNSGV